MLDRSGTEPIRVFESGAILMYLAEKFGALLPTEPAARAECLSWLFWQMGSAPFLGGGFGHFYAYAPSTFEYPINRFAMEVKRQLDVLDRRLAESDYLAGPHYTIADIGVWPWYGQLVQGKAVRCRRVPAGAGVPERRSLERSHRCATGGERGRKVNRIRGDLADQLHERHEASDFELRTEDKLQAGKG